MIFVNEICYENMWIRQRGQRNNHTDSSWNYVWCFAQEDSENNKYQFSEILEFGIWEEIIENQTASLAQKEKERNQTSNNSTYEELQQKPQIQQTKREQRKKHSVIKNSQKSIQKRNVFCMVMTGVQWI